jgi:CRISPR-associated protein Csm3
MKGKVRSLLELESGLVVFTEGDVVSARTLKKIGEKEELKAKCEGILRVFGAGAGDREENLFGPTRVSFGDAFIEQEWLKEAREKRYPLTEEKSENKIDRIKGVAEHPRFIERVPEGTKFRFLITFKIFDDKDRDLFRTLLLKGLRLLEMDTLGGSGSRGYGRLEFSFDDKDIEREFKTLTLFN